MAAEAGGRSDGEDHARTAKRNRRRAASPAIDRARRSSWRGRPRGGGQPHSRDNAHVHRPGVGFGGLVAELHADLAALERQGGGHRLLRAERLRPVPAVPAQHEPVVAGVLPPPTRSALSPDVGGAAVHRGDDVPGRPARDGRVEPLDQRARQPHRRLRRPGRPSSAHRRYLRRTTVVTAVGGLVLAGPPALRRAGPIVPGFGTDPRPGRGRDPRPRRRRHQDPLDRAAQRGVVPADVRGGRADGRLRDPTAAGRPLRRRTVEVAPGRGHRRGRRSGRLRASRSTPFAAITPAR